MKTFKLKSWQEKVLRENEDSHFRLFIEASTLGFKPNIWPEKIETTLGNKMPFVLQASFDGLCDYIQANGVLRLRIFND